MAFTLRASSGGGDKPHIVAPAVFGGNNTSGPIHVAPALNACASASGRMDFESEAFVVQCVTGDITHALKAEGFDASEDGTGRGQPIVPVAFNHQAGGSHFPICPSPDLANTLQASQMQAVVVNYAVRRLMPIECERLQAFPDGYTLVPVRGKPAADGPRYKSLGNSMCVNVMHWIGKRLDRVLRTSVPANDNQPTATTVAA